MKRFTIALVALAIAAWCCLLFGIGLDDVANRRTGPGVIFSVVVLPVILGGFLYGAFRIARPRIRRRSTQSR